MGNAVATLIDNLRERGGLKGSDVANLAEVSPATVSRWSSGQAMPNPHTQLVIADLKYVVDRLSDFYTPEETRLWLYARHQLLEGNRAIDLIHLGKTETVLAIIESLEAGEYT